MNLPSVEVKTNDGRGLVIKRRSRVKPSFNSSFTAKVQLFKEEFCEKCLGKMRRTGTRWQQATSGPIAGWDITTYKCRNPKCGHTHEESISRD